MKQISGYLIRWSALALFLILGQGMLAQRTVSGTVTDAETGESLIGVNILVVGTATGTITDFDGTYSVSVPEGAEELEFSYTGYTSQRVSLGASNVLDIQLVPGELLDEVVVIGYGTVKKSDATGVVAAVSEEDFNRGAIVSPDQLIAGKVAGVQITSKSGEPGGQNEIRIRGGTSINASNEPLFVIDGVPIDNSAHNPGGFSDGRNPLNFLNPNDIETFTVLKDASATAIYGSRGANGVIIITTKKGKAGAEGRVTYDGYFTSSQLASDIPNLDAEAFRNVVTFKAANRLPILGNTNTDWFDQMTQTALGHSHSLSFSGGAEKVGYRASVGYQDLDGVVIGSNTKRTTVAINYNQLLFNDNLKINGNFKGAFTKDQFDAGKIGDAWNFDPTQPVLDADSPWGGYFEYQNNLAPQNPVSANEQNEDFGESWRNLGNIELTYDMPFAPGLSAKLNLGYDINNGQRLRFRPSTMKDQVTNNGEIRSENFNRTNTLGDFYLNYSKNFSQSNLDFTAGYSYQDFSAEYPRFTAFDLSVDYFGPNSIAPANEVTAANSVEENRLISFWGRMNYSLYDKYLLTLTVRRDGSSRFGENNRWGTFPSAAFAWRILQEDFAAGLTDIFSDLKLRLGYGITGSQEIGNYRYLATYTFGDPMVRYLFGDRYITTVRPNGYDPNLKWEETSSYNIGLDYGFMNGRINGSVEYYYKRTDDLLFEVAVASGTNLTDQVLTNIGEVENQGVEFSINGAVIDQPDLRWDLAFNAAFNRNEILRVDAVNDPDFEGFATGGISGGVGNNIQILRVGSPVNAFYVFNHKLDADGNPLVDGVDHNDDGEINLADMYEDTNGDGIVNDNDKVPFEQPAPDVILGLTSQLYFGKGFDLAFTLRGNIGNYVYNNNASNGGYFNRVITEIVPNNLHESVLETNFTAPQYFSDYYMEDASFLRMDNITLGYTFSNLPRNMSLRLYGTAQNLFVLTNYSGLDPEVGSGIDNNPFPRSRAFIFGLSLGL